MGFRVQAAFASSDLPARRYGRGDLAITLTVCRSAAAAGNHTGRGCAGSHHYGDSPYQSLSTFAGNPNLIRLTSWHSLTG